jgi:pyruvate/2-oxoglutarate dehydrogenase complex dihydrolipoamide acyltransferase (E2) component
MFGIDNFDAVINPPHGAILAVGAGVKKPVVGEDGELAVATVMSVTLASITGSSTARWGRSFCRRSSTTSRTRW